MRGDRSAEVERLERLWAGSFGDDYTVRNVQAAAERDRFWRSLLGEIEVTSVLEVGCNVGGNLRWVADLLPEARIVGVDVNERALAALRTAFPGVEAVPASATELPFGDASFDLVFTTGVLIHLPDDALPVAMGEIVRCSRRYVLCGEYFAKEPVEVEYRGLAGALFKRDYGRLYAEAFPELRLRDKGFLPREEGGWDDITWWLFERQ